MESNDLEGGPTGRAQKVYHVKKKASTEQLSNLYAAKQFEL